MNYLLKTNRSPRSPLRTAMISTGVFLVVVAGVRLVAPSFFSVIVETLALPFWKTEDNVLGGTVMTRDALITENTRLHQALLTEQSKNIEVDVLKQENEELKTVLGRSSHQSTVLATVVRKPPYSPYDTLTLDIGTRQNIKQDATVRTLSGVAIGKIVDVHPYSSRALLYSTPGEKYDVIVGSTSIMATAVGKGGGTFEISLPRDAKIVVGDAVTIPTLSNNIFGVVGSVISDPSRPFATILFQAPINIQELKWVTVDGISEN